MSSPEELGRDQSQLARWAFSIYSLAFVSIVLVSVLSSLADQSRAQQRYEDAVVGRLNAISSLLKDFEAKSPKFFETAVAQSTFYQLQQCEVRSIGKTKKEVCKRENEILTAINRNTDWIVSSAFPYPSRDEVEEIARIISKAQATDTVDASRLLSDLSREMSGKNSLPLKPEAYLALAQAIRALYLNPASKKLVAQWALFGVAPEGLVKPVWQAGPGSAGPTPIGYFDSSRHLDFQAFKNYLSAFVSNHGLDSDFDAKFQAMRETWLSNVALGQLNDSNDHSAHVGMFETGLSQFDVGLAFLISCAYLVFSISYVVFLRNGIVERLPATFPSFGFRLGGTASHTSTYPMIGWFVLASIPVVTFICMLTLLSLPDLIGPEFGQTCTATFIQGNANQTADSYVHCDIRSKIIIFLTLACLLITIWIQIEEEKVRLDRSPPLGILKFLAVTLVVAACGHSIESLDIHEGGVVLFPIDALFIPAALIVMVARARTARFAIYFCVGIALFSIFHTNYLLKKHEALMRGSYVYIYMPREFCYGEECGHISD